MSAARWHRREPWRQTPRRFLADVRAIDPQVRSEHWWFLRQALKALWVGVILVSAVTSARWSATWQAGLSFSFVVLMFTVVNLLVESEVLWDDEREMEYQIGRQSRAFRRQIRAWNRRARRERRGARV